MSQPKPRLESLRLQLIGAMVENFEGKMFLAHSTLGHIMTGIDLDECLREADVRPSIIRNEVREAVQNGGQKMFAILCIMEDQPLGLLSNFLKADHMNSEATLDSRLPFTHMDYLIECLHSVPLAAEFFKSQWPIISPLFREDRSDRTFNRYTILPFVRRTIVGTGAYGEVFEVTFHQTHHAFGFAAMGQTVKLACKEMHTSLSAQTFASEKSILTLLRQIRHENMIQLLASYSIMTQENGLTRCLIFPLAETSLQTLIDEDSNDLVPRYFRSHEEYLCQVYGLSSGLENLHNFVDATELINMKGCHFDLAPRNVLVQESRLLLADFGLSRLRNEDSNSVTPFKGGAGDYIAPECTAEVFGPDYLHGRKSDVWSFGGILSVMVVFLKLGKEDVADYRKARCNIGKNGGTTFRFHADGCVHHGMQRWVEDFKKILSQAECATFNLAVEMLNTNANERPAMDKVTTYLYLLAMRGRFRAIDEQFADLVAKRPAIQLQIEEQRFTIWSGMATLTEQRSDPVSELQGGGEHASWLLTSKTQFQVISRTLRELQDENNLLLEGLNLDNPIAPIYGRIHELIDTLWSTAPLGKRRRMLTMFESSLDRLYNSLGREPASVSVSTTSWETQALLLATIRFMNRKSRPREQSRGQPLSLAISGSLVKITQRIGNASIAYVEGSSQPAFCEWVNYELHTIDQVPDRLFNRIEAVARNFTIQPLPADFNVLHCRGYFHDPSGARFGLLFDYPPSASTALPFVTLRDILKRTPRPSLEWIFSVAQTLIKSVHHFHRADWVHKNVSSHNVIFFKIFQSSHTESAETYSQEHDIVLDQLSTPYLVGFNHSRPTDPHTFTRGSSNIDKIYLHPEYAKLPEPRFGLGYEYFSVGLLLLEIGLWEPITRSRLLQDRYIEDFALADLHGLWREEGVPLLGPLMGAIYRDAVMLCLSDYFVGKPDSWAMEEFGLKVVQEIERCCV